MPMDITKNYKRERQMNPKKCAQGSFRTKSIGKHGKKIVVCCLKGHYKRDRCQTGMKTQSILTPR